MITLVADDLFDPLAIRPDRLDLLSGLNQRLDARRRIPVVGILHIVRRDTGESYQDFLVKAGAGAEAWSDTR